jgi:hypothetical protein
MTDPEVRLIVCYSRCLWCGRRTPHEICEYHSRHGYAHLDESDAKSDSWERRWYLAQNRAWKRWANRPAETCDVADCGRCAGE